MPSHIFLRLGDYEASAAVNVTASKVDRELYPQNGSEGNLPADVLLAQPPFCRIRPYVSGQL